uniref:C9orf72-SMCR8 complex subunit n=1 Tax=Eptatretus burgeri TaxID=7764 RepID=A0A8C4QL05_EPTBU
MALALVLPLAERAFYLPLHAACTARLAHTVRRLRILLQKESKLCINLLTVELQSLVQQFVSLKRFGVSPDIVISNTFLGENLEDPRKRDFLHKAISSHLQTCGCSIIVGSDVERVNKMVKTLCLFLSPMERRSSRLAVSPMQGNYEAGLYVQGLLKDSSGTVTLPFRRLVCAPLPSSLVDVDPPGEVRQTPPIHEHHMRREQFFHAELACSWHNQQQLSLASGTDNLNVFQEVRWSDPLVGSFVAEVSLVSDGAGQRMLLAQFILMLQRKALVLLEYVENETQRGKRQLRSLWQLKTDLDLTGDGTLAVVMAIAEKMRPGLHAVLFSHPQSSLPERD